MEDQTKGGIHWSFWVIAGITFVWNALTAVNFFVQMDPEMVASFRETERAIIEGRPIWATSAFACAAFGGAIGSILLLLKKWISYYLFIASFVGVVVAIFHSITASIQFGFGEIIGIVLMPVVVAAFLIWYSKYTRSRGWIS